jgi:hypothetical protein
MQALERNATTNKDGSRRREVYERIKPIRQP